MTDLSPRPVADAAPRGRTQRRWIPIVVLGLVLVAGGVIVTQFLRSAVDYYCNADEIGVRSGCDADRRLRVQGTVDAGSLSESNGDTAFTITFNDVTVPVRYDGQPGGIFKECMPVIVHGRLEGDTFMGDDIEVKHDSSYEAANPERLAEAEADAASTCPTDGG
ncbi:MAG TPA: cytochrome c maturation protein CcmE [Ilumatobacteraceae bacterium]|nr:cytochrome c maturation protein CcmE [Ilumatobacteraceae bacterium]